MRCARPLRIYTRIVVPSHPAIVVSRKNRDHSGPNTSFGKGQVDLIISLNQSSLGSGRDNAKLPETTFVTSTRQKKSSFDGVKEGLT